ncbi:NAD(P)-dependent alcohol dehydrogenase [Allosediminivita pacifica]|uniref:Putative zinc-type alcohol dehydrogenase-like protein n=1 Tax=Allosediminivita pacifica TaxID=1267769 RepID=A0A2T6A6J8_9RHOB|nr:NAD(P)-dependent alcohol dehydrogenase [Allosediminivita pacifica]PTX39382.1 putative zinc-type alcohol dehydrogenase-like protein [Allosediminivita pacifica]GGB27965.1 alcohol dehydrogenase [Allosediminivita pacifica]
MCEKCETGVEILTRNGEGRRNFLRGGAAVAAAPLAAAGFSGSRAAAQPSDALAQSEVQAWAARDTDGTFAPYTITRREARPKDVVIDIMYSSICHSDIHTYKGDWGMPNFPLVPGHEMVGRVVGVGSEVTKFREGDIAGVGTMVDSCGECVNCLADREQNCLNGTTFTYDSPDQVSGGVTYGGYSKRIVVTEDFVLRIPPGVDLAGFAPLLCAGITTFSPINHWDLKPGQRYGVIGMGGLGHLAVKLGAAKGAEVVVFTTSQDKLEDARSFGASEAYLWSDEEGLRSQMASFDLMLSTVPVAYPMQQFLNMLKLDKTLVNVGALFPVEGAHGMMMGFGRQSLAGSMTGGIAETQRVIDFAAHHGVAATYEMITPDQIGEACERVVNRQARYRYVIDMTAA